MPLRTFRSPRQEIESLRQRLQEAEQTLHAIRSGEADSIVVETPAGPRVFTLEGAAHPYRVLVEAMDEGAANLAPDGALLYANRRLAEMLDVPLEQLIGASIREYVPPERAADFEALLRDAGERGESRGELPVRTRSGREIPVYLSLGAVDDESGRVLCLMMTDLREQKRNEEIVAAERLARSVLEQAAEAIVVCDEEGRVVRSNDAAAAICGTNPLRRPFDEVFPIQPAPNGTEPPLAAPARGHVAAAALRGEVLRAAPARLRRPDGSVVDLLVSATRLQDERPLGCVVNLVDVTEQRRSEETERRYAELLQLSDDAIFVWRLHGGIETWNRGAEELFGYTAGDAIGRRPSELLATVFPVPWTAIEASLRMWGRWEGELEQRTREGRTIVASTKMRLVLGDDGAERVLESARDMTDRKAMERSLRASEERARVQLEEIETIYRSAPVGLAVLDREGRYLRLNERLADLNGVSVRDHLGRTMREVLPLLGDQVEGVLHRVLETGEAVTDVSVEGETAALPGTVRSFVESWIPLRDGTGRVAAVNVVVEEVTGRKRAEREREGAMAELSAILSSMTDGMVVYRPDATVALVNPAAEELLGLPPGNWPKTHEGMLGLGFVTETGTVLGREESTVRRALAGEATAPINLKLRRGDGSEVWMSVSAAPIVTAHGERLGAVALLRDITDRVQTDEKEKDLVRMVSHDLRTPLGALLLQAQMIQRVTDPSDPNVRRAEMIITNGMKMAAMIRDLVEMIRLESGQFRVDLQEVDFESFAMGLRDRLAGTLDAERIDIECAPGLPPLWVDPERLERVLVNLLSNALRHSPRTEPVRVVAKVADHGIRISVVDRGSGIPPEDLPHLFERFYRARTGRRSEGLGLGLYIAQVMVRAHGGTIHAESEVGRGTSFHVDFPHADLDRAGFPAAHEPGPERP